MIYTSFPDIAQPAGLQLRFLGSPPFILPDQTTRKFSAEKVLALFAYLAIEGRQRPISRSHLAALLWPGYTQKSALTNLRTALYRLRQSIAPFSLVKSDRQGLWLATQDDNIRCDLWVIEDAATDAGAAALLDPKRRELLQDFQLDDCPEFMAWLEEQRRRYTSLLDAALASPLPSPQQPLDWGDIPSPVALVDREAELEQLCQWVVEAKAKVVGIVGIGGQGKSVLAAAFARRMTTRSDTNACGVIWRSLLNAPPWEQTFQDWIGALSNQTVTDLPDHPDRQFALLIDLLREHKVLLVLDNVETIMQGAGHFLSGNEIYGQMIQRLAHSDHNSCLLLTSREIPSTLERLEQTLPGVCLLPLPNLSPKAGKSILEAQGIRGSDDALHRLVASYSGNPLALLLTSRIVRNLFAGDATAFLAQETRIFGDIEEVLTSQFARLSKAERALIFWLAVEREPVPLDTLYQDLVGKQDRLMLLEALRGLRRRLLIEIYSETSTEDTHPAALFGLQNVVLEYATEQLRRRIVTDLVEGTFDWLNSHALLKAQSKDYVRESQRRLLLQPVAAVFEEQLGRAAAEEQLRYLLRQRQNRAKTKGRGKGYAPANILHLSIALGLEATPWDFSGLTLRQADLRSSTLPALDLSNAHLLATPVLEPMGWPDGLTFSGDGRLLAIASAQGETRIWDRLQQRNVWSHIQRDDIRQYIAFSPDGRWMAFVGAQGQIQIWDTDKWQLQQIFHANSTISKIYFHPNGKVLITAGTTISLWELESGNQIAWDIAPLKIVLDVAIHPSGEVMACAGHGGVVYLREMANGRTVQVIEENLPVISRLAFSPSGRWLVAGGRSEELFVWSMPTGQRKPGPHFHEDKIYAFAFMPDKDWLAYGGLDRVIRLWDVETETPRGLLPGHNYVIMTLAFSPDGSILASGSADRTVRLWDWRSGRSVATIYCYENALRTLSLTSDESKLAVAGSEGAITLWSLPFGPPPRTLRQHKGVVLATAFSPDGALLASAGADGDIVLWETASGKLHSTLRGHGKLIESLSFDPSGRFLASAGYDSYLYIWDITQGQVHTTLPISHPIACVRFHPNGNSLAFTGDQQRIWLCTFDPLMGCTNIQTIAFPDVEAGYSMALEFDPSGMWLACSAQRAIHILCADTGQIVKTIRKEGYWMPNLVFDPAGKRLAGHGPNTAIHLYDTQSGKLVRALEGHTAYVYSLAFGAKGVRLYSCALHGDVRVWDVESGECLRVIYPPGPYAGMNIRGTTGINEAQRVSLMALGAVE